MKKTTIKITAIILGVLAVYITLQLIPGGTKKRLTSLSKRYQFDNEITITEKFTTDFTSSYGIHLHELDSAHNGITDTILPLAIDLKILKDETPIELLRDYKNGYFLVNGNAQLTSFFSKANTTYKIQLHIKSNNSSPQNFLLSIATNVPGPGYDLLIEKEFKWIFWCMDAVLIFIAFIVGYFGFRKEPCHTSAS